jgi:recombination protein RecA
MSKQISQKGLDSLQKAFGKEGISNLSDKPKLNIEWLPTGSLALDHALGGGFPLGRIVELGGPESSGKTTLAIHAIAEAQKRDKVCAFIDAEHAFDPVYASTIGVDVDSLLISQPSNGEEAFDLVEALILTNEVEVIVIDSTANLTPKAEIDGEMGDNQMGLQARLLSKAMRKITSIAGKYGVLVVLISQIREKIGVMFGSPEKMGMGNAVKFYASQRVDIRRSTQSKDKEGQADGNLTRAKVIKNKVAPPFQVAEYTIKYGIGIDKELEIIDLAIELQIIEKAGSWFSYGETKLGQGKDNVISIVRDNPEFFEEIKALVLEGMSQQ